MSITPVPYLKIEDAEIASGLTPAATEIALSGFSISYGRDSTFDQPSPARLSASFLLRAGSPWMTHPIAERGIQVWVRYPGGQRRIFLGRARDAEVTHLRDELFTMRVTASDTLADLERQQIHFNRGTEAARARLDFLADYARGIISGIGGPAFWHELAPKETRASVLSEIAAIFTSGGEGIDYDPHTNRIEALSRPGSYTLGLSLVKTPRGTYAVSSRADGSGVIRAVSDQAEATAGARHDLDNVIPRIHVTGKDWNGIWRSSEWVAEVGGGNGYGTLRVTSDGYSQELEGRRDGGGLKLTWDLWRELVLDARTPAHPPLRTCHTSFDSVADMIETIGCREYRRPVYIASSPYTAGALRLCRALGGTVTYHARKNAPGKWVVERRFANVPVTFTGAPVTSGTINPRGNIRFRDLDETATAASLAWTTQGA